MHRYREPPSGTAGANAIRDGATSLSWQVASIDGKFSPAAQADGLRQAISNKADGVIVYGVDCATNKTTFEAVKAANIPVVAVNAVDCSASDSSQQTLFTRQAAFAPDGVGTYQQFQRFGAAKADWITVATNGNAQIIQLRTDEFANTKAMQDRFVEHLKSTCPGCQIVAIVSLTSQDFGPALQAKMQQALLHIPRRTPSTPTSTNS